MNNFKTFELTSRLDRTMEYALYFLVVGVSISNGLTSIGMGAVLLVWAFKKAVLGEKFSAPRPLVILAGVLFLAFAASLIHSEYLGQSIHALFLKYGKYLLLMLAIAEGIREKRVAIRMALVLCLVATAICFDGFYQYFSGKDFLMFREAGRLDVFWTGLSFRSFRVTATFPAANTFASYLVPVLMLGLAFSFLGAKTRKIVWGKGVCLGSMVLCLLLTFSRGGLIACSGGVLMLVFLLKKKILLIIPMIFLVIFFSGRELYGNRAAQKGVIDPTVETRLLMLKDATQMFRLHPWTGIGLNTYYKAHEKDHSLAIPPSYAHNSYAQILVEVGMLGFMSFMALMIYWFGWGMSAFRKFRDPELRFLLGGVLAGVFGLCLASFFDNVLFELLPATLFWVLMGYGAALIKLGSNNKAL
ncbi:MAG: O-antigen ligase family protein [Candidatus Omnitrophica bacterium]|nr:O-antigen ligase family protein [Candidatus Omnitrophota bacterium]